MILNKCILCKRESALISSCVGFCSDCLRNNFEKTEAILVEKHKKTRDAFCLPSIPLSLQKGQDSDKRGKRCGWCYRDCIIGEGERGFCNMRTVENGRMKHIAGTPKKGMLHWYRDPLPTNCVADWVCEGSRMSGFHNLAVFYGSCTFNCLFCQNWHYRMMNEDGISSEELDSFADKRTFCVCYFGGEPSSQILHAIVTSKKLFKKGVRICWETNGTMSRKFLLQAIELSLESGGCIKFDLKAYDCGIHFALTGASNKRTFENFAYAGEFIKRRKNLPLLIASTLLVPGYIDSEEVRKIARFIASISPDIPYALLGFYPHFYMKDLPVTSIRHAEECKKSAEEEGLVNVRIGNRHLLGDGY